MTFVNSSRLSCTPTIRRNGQIRNDGLMTAIGLSNFLHWSCANERPRRSTECSAASGSSMLRDRCFQRIWRRCQTILVCVPMPLNTSSGLCRLIFASWCCRCLPGARRGERLELAESRYGLRPMTRARVTRVPGRERRPLAAELCPLCRGHSPPESPCCRGWKPISNPPMRGSVKPLPGPGSPWLRD